MVFLKTALTAAAITAFVATGTLVATTSAASARIACNSDGDWVAVPGVQFNYHPDDWYFHQHWDGNDRHYRDYHDGRGYYKGGVWITL